METINDEQLGKLFLYGSLLFTSNDNAILIKATITFMSSTGDLMKTFSSAISLHTELNLNLFPTPCASYL